MGKEHRGASSGGTMTITRDRAPESSGRGGGKIPYGRASSCARSYASAGRWSRLPADCQKLIGSGGLQRLDRIHAAVQGLWPKLSDRYCRAVRLHELGARPGDGLCPAKGAAGAASAGRPSHHPARSTCLSSDSAYCPPRDAGGQAWPPLFHRGFYLLREQLFRRGSAHPRRRPRQHRFSAAAATSCRRARDRARGA